MFQFFDAFPRPRNVEEPIFEAMTLLAFLAKSWNRGRTTSTQTVSLIRVRDVVFRVAFKRRKQNLQDVRIVMVGDSVMRMQYACFTELLGGIEGINATFVHVNWGLAYNP
jgi:hypothetical protein